MPLPADAADEIDRKALAAVRTRFLRLQRARLARVGSVLPPPQADFLEVLALLLHVNHPRLPGFAGVDAPSGVAGYEPGEGALRCARMMARSFRYERRALRRAPIQGLYLVGSLGSLGQSAASDLDVWLCYDPQLGPAQLDALHAKVARIEAHAHQLGLDAHVFLVDVERFRQGAGVPALSEESSGSTQHLLLLDEFYRSGIHVAGRAPLWWLIPPGSGFDHASLARRLVAGRFVDPAQWLDFGSLAQLAPGEFFGAAHWQLFKGIDAPYKSLLKILLMEAYAAEFPDLHWLSDDLKIAVHAGREGDLDSLDAYVTLYKRVERHLLGSGRPERLDLARRALYLKAGLALSTFRGSTWKAEALRSLVASWGWSEQRVGDLDGRARWPLERVREERDQLVAELARSHGLLTAFAQRHASVAAIDARELTVLERKLRATSERRPGRIEWVNLCGSTALGEPALLLHPGSSKGGWQLERAGGGLLKHGESAFEVLAWAHLNGVMTRSTHVACETSVARPTPAELQRARAALVRHVPSGRRPAAPLSALAQPASSARALALTNLGSGSLPGEGGEGTVVLTARNDPLCFGESRACLVQRIDYLTQSTWGEIDVHCYVGPDGVLDFLCQHLQRSSPTRGATADLECQGVAGARPALVARRLGDLVRDTAHAFSVHGANIRYVASVGGSHYVVQGDEGRYGWVRAHDAASLRELLAEPPPMPRPVIADRGALPGDPLSAVLQPGQESAFRAYTLTRADRIELYVIDAQGALFHQAAPGSDETFFLQHQRRVLEQLARRQMPASRELPHGWPAGAVRFYRLARAGPGWEATPIVVPHTPDDTGLALTTVPGGGFRLACAGEEVDSRTLGDGIYEAAARLVLRQRHGVQGRPIYLTAIQSTASGAGAPRSAIPLLALKGRIETRLEAARDGLGS